jgi:hypothetical protein
MPDHSSQAELLSLIQAHRTAFDARLTGVSEQHLSQPAGTENWSIKDMLAHVVWWEQWMLRVLQGDAEAEAQLARFRTPHGQEVVDQLNAVTFQRNHPRPVDEVLAEAHASFQQVLQTLSTVPASLLTTYARVIAANTFEHYEEHLRQLEDVREQRQR